MIDFLDELGNFKQKNFYTSKFQNVKFEMSGKDNTTNVEFAGFGTDFAYCGLRRSAFMQLTL